MTGIPPDLEEFHPHLKRENLDKMENTVPEEEKSLAHLRGELFDLSFKLERGEIRTILEKFRYSPRLELLPDLLLFSSEAWSSGCCRAAYSVEKGAYVVGDSLGQRIDNALQVENGILIQTAKGFFFNGKHRGEEISLNRFIDIPSSSRRKLVRFFGDSAISIGEMGAEAVEVDLEERKIDIVPILTSFSTESGVIEHHAFEDAFVFGEFIVFTGPEASVLHNISNYTTSPMKGFVKKFSETRLLCVTGNKLKLLDERFQRVGNEVQGRFDRPPLVMGNLLLSPQLTLLRVVGDSLQEVSQTDISNPHPICSGLLFTNPIRDDTHLFKVYGNEIRSFQRLGKGYNRIVPVRSEKRVQLFGELREKIGDLPIPKELVNLILLFIETRE